MRWSPTNSLDFFAIGKQKISLKSIRITSLLQTRKYYEAVKQFQKMPPHDGYLSTDERVMPSQLHNSSICITRFGTWRSHRNDGQRRPPWKNRCTIRKSEILMSVDGKYTAPVRIHNCHQKHYRKTKHKYYRRTYIFTQATSIRLTLYQHWNPPSSRWSPMTKWNIQLAIKSLHWSLITETIITWQRRSRVLWENYATMPLSWHYQST